MTPIENLVKLLEGKKKVYCLWCAEKLKEPPKATKECLKCHPQWCRIPFDEAILTIKNWSRGKVVLDKKQGFVDWVFEGDKPTTETHVLIPKKNLLTKDERNIIIASMAYGVEQPEKIISKIEDKLDKALGGDGK